VTSPENFSAYAYNLGEHIKNTSSAAQTQYEQLTLEEMQMTE